MCVFMFTCHSQRALSLIRTATSLHTYVSNRCKEQESRYQLEQFVNGSNLVRIVGPFNRDGKRTELRMETAFEQNRQRSRKPQQLNRTQLKPNIKTRSLKIK